MTGFLKKTLRQLVEDTPIPVPVPLPDIKVTGIVMDSRQVQPGYLFVAIPGETTDGHRYIPQAVQMGAAAVVGSRSDVTCPVPYIPVADTRQALAHLSASFYNFPARQMTVIGVTGTDGKTTTANLIYQILLSAGCRVGIISTINATIGTEVLDTGFHVTTPEAPDVQRFLARMLAAGLSHVVLEATSHGLDQHRVTGCEFDVAVVTNITHEHLDYHRTFEAYREAKARLFTALAETSAKQHGNPRTAVLNRDDESSYAYLSEKVAFRQISYGLQPGANVCAEAVHTSPSGMNFTCLGPGLTFPVQSQLVGHYNVSNCLAAIGATVFGLDLSPEAAQRGIAALSGVPGRSELIDLGQDFSALVDFAHTPNALQRILETAHKLLQNTPGGRVLAVFGSAGLRDRQKRRMMAEVSARLADLTIFTAEDPRTESLDDILEEMAIGAASQGGVEGKTFWRVPDRGDAIHLAVRMAQPGDLVVACGKGHEQSMCFGEEEYPWDDRVAMRAALAEHLGISGPTMPYLPTQKRPDRDVKVQ
jgi:UDP-N-acetylmuramoyl-L-alanyl-D-glutamate--2,6-diaminopimelate ligase